MDATQIFSKAKKELILQPLAKLGFKAYKSTAVARLAGDGVFQYISFHKYRFGGQFKVVAAIRPLYCYNDDDLSQQPGNTLPALAGMRDNFWWKFASEAVTNQSFTEVSGLVQKYALPFFEATTTSADIIKASRRNIFGRTSFGNRVDWGAKGWNNFDFGHMYLKNGDNANAIKQFTKCSKEFRRDGRDWALCIAQKCTHAKDVILSGQPGIDQYLKDTVEDSKIKLKIANWQVC